MKTIRLLLGAGLIGTALGAGAESKVTTVIDGTEINKELTRLTFEGDAVTLTFSDNSTRQADMKFVAVRIEHPTSAISSVISDRAKPSGIYNLKGQYLGASPEGLRAGFYIVNGQKVYVK